MPPFVPRTLSPGRGSGAEPASAWPAITRATAATTASAAALIAPLCIRAMLFLPGRKSTGECPASADLDLVAGRGEVGLDLSGVFGAAGLEDEVDGGLAEVELGEVADVGELEDVRAGRGDRGEQVGEAAGAVGDEGRDPDAAALGDLVAVDRRGEQSRVDVAAGEDRRGRSPSASAGSTAPLISAATAIAPAPSVTSFARSASRTIASTITSSPTVTMPSSQRSISGRVSSPGRLTAMPSAIVRALGVSTGSWAAIESAIAAQPSAWTPITSIEGSWSFSAIASPLASPPPPTGTSTRRRFGHLGGELDADAGLAADHVGVVEGVDELEPVGGRRLAGERDAGVDRLAAADDLALEGADRLDLADRRRLRHVDAAGQALGAGGVGERLRVVAGAAGDDARALPRPDRVELRERAADLEAAGPLQVLGLEHDLAADLAAEAARRHRRRLADELAAKRRGRSGARRGRATGGWLEARPSDRSATRSRAPARSTRRVSTFNRRIALLR